MSNIQYPVLPGLEFNLGMTPSFSTKVQKAASGRELRAAFQLYPMWTFSLSYEFLRDGARGADFDTLGGFFLARQGMFDSFLFSAPSDNAVVAMPFGVGDGATKNFQLTRAFGAGGFSFIEPVMNVSGSPGIYINGVLQGSGYSVGSTGIVAFTGAPTNGLPLTWTGSFLYRCRFLQDASQFELFMQDLWQLKKIEFIGAPGNKV